MAHGGFPTQAKGAAPAPVWGVCGSLFSDLPLYRAPAQNLGQLPALGCFSVTHTLICPYFPHPETGIPNFPAAESTPDRKFVSPASRSSSGRIGGQEHSEQRRRQACSRSCHTTQLPPSTSCCCLLLGCSQPLLSTFKWARGLQIPWPRDPWPSRLPPAKHSWAFFPAVIKHMSHSSAWLILLECEGFSVQTIFNRG